jgi:hypothetical protein
MAGEIAAKTWNTVLAAMLTRSPSWTRLEPQSVTGDPASGLAAPVHDPLWLLTRQWQFGEFAGEDAGTPLAVHIDADVTPMSDWQPGDWTAQEPQPARPLAEAPLDVLVEREASAAPPGLRVRAQAGAALVTALRDAGLAAAADAVPANAGLDVDDPDAGPGWAALVAVLAGRAVDAEKAAAALESAPAGALPGWLDGPQRDAIGEVTRRWLDWYRGEVTPPADASSWVGPRLEHRFSVVVGDHALRAPEAADGVADWCSFDVEPVGAVGLPTEPLTHRSVATPLRFAGMPADRFWEFEDAQIDIGALESNPHDLARLLVAECALIYGCDWLNVPVDLPAGSLVAVRTVFYRTTFGETYRVGAPAGPRPTPDEPWRMFVVTSPEKAWDKRAAAAGELSALDGLVVAPATATRVEGPAVEEVLFLRDEAANLGWAVERVIEDPAGDARLRTGERHNEPVDEQHRVAEAELDYLLQTSVPQWWIPYVPRVSGTLDAIQLELARGAMMRFGPGLPPTGAPIRALGRLLTDPDHAVVFDAEIPRQGVRVQRIPMLSRRSDGSYDLWTARRVSSGRGEGRSGLAFDSAVPRPAAEG